MLIAVNRKSLINDVREKLSEAIEQKTPIRLTEMQARALYELAKSHPDEVVQFESDGPITRKRKSRAKQEQAEKLPLKGTATVAVSGPVTAGQVLAIDGEGDPDEDVDATE